MWDLCTGTSERIGRDSAGHVTMPSGKDRGYKVIQNGQLREGQTMADILPLSLSLCPTLRARLRGKRSTGRRFRSSRTRRRRSQILRDPLDRRVRTVRIRSLEHLLHQRHGLVQTPPTVTRRRAVRRTQRESSTVTGFPGRTELGTARAHGRPEGRLGHAAQSG